MSDGCNTKEIWDRQINNFWEIVWTVSDRLRVVAGIYRSVSIGEHIILRKSLGDKCTVMHDLQELSGYVRAKGRTQREKQDKFWRQIISMIVKLVMLNLNEDERLSAIALVKRLFPVADGALDWTVDAERWPSTVYVGALPWMELAHKHAKSEIEAHTLKEVKEIDISNKNFTFRLRMQTL